MIHETAIIYPGVEIEDNVTIGAYCVIGAPPDYKGKEDQGKGVLIKSGTYIHSHVTIDSGVEDKTVIGNDCYIMKHAYIAHDCQIGNKVTLSGGVLLAGHVRIDDLTNLGMGTCVHQRVHIPGGCMFGMGSVVTKRSQLVKGGKYVGNPIRFIGWNTIR